MTVAEVKRDSFIVVKSNMLERVLNLKKEFDAVNTVDELKIVLNAENNSLKSISRGYSAINSLVDVQKRFNDKLTTIDEVADFIVKQK